MKTNKKLLDSFKVEWTISDMQSREDAGLLVTIDATHAGYINRNFYYYDAAGMRKAVKSWTKPFPKPVLKNHDKESEPMGRVKNARYIGNNENGFIQLDVLITDPDAIQKIKDKRYLTVSTSGDPVESVVCSVCGQDHLKAASFCGHSRGVTYEDEDGNRTLCYWKVGSLRYKEVSFVNAPADQSQEHAALVTSWKFQDEEGDVTINTQDTIEHKGAVHMSDTLWTPKTPKDKSTVVRLLSEGADLIANKTLFDSIGEEDPNAAIDAYIDAGGQFKGDLTTPLTDEDLELIALIKDNVYAIEDADEVILTERTADNEHNKEHRHVVWKNEAGNGFTDYVLNHGHEVVDGEVQPTRSRKYNPDKEAFETVYGHSHSIAKDAEGVKKDAQMGDSPSDERNESNPFTDFSRIQIEQALNIIAVEAPNNTVLSDFIKERATELGVAFPDELAQTSAMLNDMVAFI